MSELCLCFGLDAANDEAQIHPHSFCKRCYGTRDAAQAKGSESTSPFQQPHGAVQVGSSCIRWWVLGEENVVVTLTNLHNLHSNHSFVTILQLNMMVEDHIGLKRP